MTEPLISRMARIAFEGRLLVALAAAPEGLTLGQLRERFQNEAAAHTIEHLVDRGQAHRFDGLVYGITEKGRSRLVTSAPACVQS